MSEELKPCPYQECKRFAPVVELSEEEKEALAWADLSKDYLPDYDSKTIVVLAACVRRLLRGIPAPSSEVEAKESAVLDVVESALSLIEGPATGRDGLKLREHLRISLARLSAIKEKP